MKYIGPISAKGLILKGVLWKTPWKWKEEEIATNIAKEKGLQKFFTKAKNGK